MISFIARMDGADVNELSLNDGEIPPEESFDGFYESRNQLFVFSKASTPAITSPLSPPLPPTSASPIPPPPDLSASDSPVRSRPSRVSRSRDESSCAASPAGGGPVSDYLRDFRGLREVRVLGKGAFGVVKLLEDPSTHDQVAVKFFDSETTLASDRSSAFFREIDALVLLTHPCVLRIVGYCLATRTLPAQIGTEFAVGGSLREALPTLKDTGKAIVIVGVVLGMKFIHSRGVIHIDLKPANILLDERGHPKIGDLGSSRFCDLRSTMTSGIGTRLYIAPDMYDSADYTAAVDIYSFSLIA
jgi:serine/threonine protein kinase